MAVKHRVLTAGARMTNPTGDLQHRAPPAEPDAPTIPATTLAARERLSTALIAASRPHQGGTAHRITAELRSAVAGYVAALRTDGGSVEQAVISTKELVAAAIGGMNATPERRALAEQVVSWGIDAYYDSTARAD